jgi:TonB family protein
MKPSILAAAVKWTALLCFASSSPVSRADEVFDVDHVFAASEVEIRPETIKITHPKYPSSLVPSGKTGMVAVAVIIDQMGDIEDVQVAKTSDPEFAQPAIDCVRYWRFNAGYHRGRNVKVRLVIPVRFTPDPTQVAGQ